MPKVSICIPTYNQVTYLKLTLESILLQTYQDYEVIITDDSTNEDVKSLIDQYDFKGKLHYYRNEESLGSPTNWNCCITKARGDYIKILHHDDWFSTSTSLEKLVQLLETDDNSFAFCGCNNLSVDGTNLFYHSITDGQASIIEKCPEFLFFNNRIGAPSVTIFKKSKIKFDENIKYLVDVDFYIQLLSINNKFSYTKDALINVGSSQEQVTNIFMNNKKLLIFEYSYTFQKSNHAAQNFKWYFNAFWNLFEFLDILSINELVNSQWQGVLPRFVFSIIKSRQFIRKVHLYKFRKIIRYFVYIQNVIVHDYYK